MSLKLDLQQVCTLCQVTFDPFIILLNIAHHGSVVNRICYAGDVAGVLCGVGGEGVCGELLHYIT